MVIIATVISGLALLAATICIILLVQEKKRNQKRSAATADYIEAEVTHAFLETNEKIESLRVETEKRISDLESGVIPDHEEAKRAVQSLNDFNRGISSIMGFDPYEALKRENQLVQTEEDD